MFEFVDIGICSHLCCFFGVVAVQIAREAEAAMFHRQMFEELCRTSHLTRDPTESVAIGAVEASFKCCASAILVLTKTGRSCVFTNLPIITERFSEDTKPHTRL